jgi:hypothetical protein
MSRNTATIAGRQISRAKILAACAEHDRLGRLAFLDRYGYARAQRWHLRANGRSYPSKAIVGVAAGLKADAAGFFGGTRGAVQALATLGFTVRNSETGEKADAKLDSLRRVCERAGLSVAEGEWPRTEVQPTAYFASGSNQPNQIRALGKAGADVGVAAPHVSANGEAELLALVGSDVAVFVDSGAFSEVKFGAEGRTVVRPMTDADWQLVLGLYERLAPLGSQLFVVAPDCIGDQDESLRRLARYADRVLALGCNVLVPVQKGALSQVEFAAAVDAILGTDWIPAMPCKKAATTAAELADFVAARNPRHVHLLGLGIRSRNLTAYLAGVGRTSVSLDSCWITANVGRKRAGPLRLTRAQDMARSVLARVRATVSHVELAFYSCFAGPGLVA